MSSKYYFYEPPKGRSKTVLKGTSKHYGDLEQYDINALLMKNAVPESAKIKTLGLKPWLDPDQNKFTQYIANRFPTCKPKSGNYTYSFLNLLKSQKQK